MADSSIVFLGTGTSFGVPMLGCVCAVCQSSDPRDRRGRCSALIDLPKGRLLIDVTPDFRSQALREGIDGLDAVIITHAHADHMHGIDDLRPLSLQGTKALAVWADARTSRVLRQTFPYIFNDSRKRAGLPWLELHELEPGREVEICGAKITPFDLEHGGTGSLGLRCGEFAYMTDLKHVPDASWSVLEGVKALALDMLRVDPPHATHLCLKESLEVWERLDRPKTWFIHMGHEVGHEELSRKLPPGTSLAFDGRRERIKALS